MGEWSISTETQQLGHAFWFGQEVNKEFKMIQRRGSDTKMYRTNQKR